MEIFFPNQRWTSEGEPELGVGIVTEVSKNRVQIHFPVLGETRLYAMENAPVRRVVFKPGDTIVDRDNNPLLIEKVKEDGNILIYFGQDRILSEADLGDVTDKHGVVDHLMTGEVDTPEVFALRRETLEHDYKRRISPINGFVGARIDLIPHQLYIAKEVSSRYAPRVLLSDQVGLGKTIEACLILHRLLLSGQISRVLILVPESLIHQWFVEILRRFNLWFSIFDEERCESLDEGAPDGNPFLDNQLIICSTSFLANSETRARQAISASWDMLVVDEAHHLKWSVDTVSPEYAVVELLSRLADGLLLLTATPEQLGLESHFARLRLLDPERYADFESFKNETLDHKEIANIIDNLSSGKDMNMTDKKLLTSIFGKERMDSVANGGEVERNNLIEDLLDQHGPGRVVFRNTRSAMSGFPKRIAHLAPISAEEHEKGIWLQRLSKEFSKDIETSIPTRQQFWFLEDSRVNWLVQKMKELNSEKILLICRSKEKVLALEKALSRLVSFNVAIFHEDLTIVQRDRNAAWFSEFDGARLLLCSEIGSEGRNFQFAHHLVLFDLPFLPELLEQRIGRLDRIGQTEDIHIHVPYILGSPQEMLVNWFHKGLDAFEQNLEGGNRVFHLFGDRLKETCLSSSSLDSSEQLESLIAETSSFQKKLKETLANGRDRLLEMNSFRPQIAEKLVEQIRKEDKDVNLEVYMTQVFEYFGVEMEDLAPRTYLLHSPKIKTEAFPSIPKGGLSITFDRKRALSREDVRFLTWDHPIVTEAIDLVLGSGTTGTSFGVFRGDGDPAILLEVIFVLETVGEKRTNVDRFLPYTPLRVVVDHTGNDVSDLYPFETFNKQLIKGKPNDFIQNEALMETFLSNMINAATDIADVLGTKEISNGLQRMNNTLNHEITRLKSLHKKNKNIRPDEIQTALEEQINLESQIKSSRIRLDALQMIKKESF
jgi:ATP-dependent helicase HepA